MRCGGPLDFLDRVWIYRCGHTRETQNAYRVLVGDPVRKHQSRGGADISLDRKEIRGLLGCEVDEYIYIYIYIYIYLTRHCGCTPRNIFIYVIGTTSYIVCHIECGYMF